MLDRLAARLPNSTAIVCDIRDPKRSPNSRRRLGPGKATQAPRRAHQQRRHSRSGARPIESLDYATWREVIDTNLHGTFLVTQAVLPFLGKGSVIVNNLSIAARIAFPGMAAYNTSKRGLLAFTETLREELRPRSIRVVALLPGAADTAIWKQFWPDAPRRRMMSPRSIAAGRGRCGIVSPPSVNFDEFVINPSAGAL